MVQVVLLEVLVVLVEMVLAEGIEEIVLGDDEDDLIDIYVESDEIDEMPIEITDEIIKTEILVMIELVVDDELEEI